MLYIFANKSFYLTWACGSHLSRVKAEDEKK